MRLRRVNLNEEWASMYIFTNNPIIKKIMEINEQNFMIAKLTNKFQRGTGHNQVSNHNHYDYSEQSNYKEKIQFMLYLSLQILEIWLFLIQWDNYLRRLQLQQNGAPSCGQRFLKLCMWTKFMMWLSTLKIKQMLDSHHSTSYFNCAANVVFSFVGKENTEKCSVF